MRTKRTKNADGGGQNADASNGLIISSTTVRPKKANGNGQKQCANNDLDDRATTVRPANADGVSCAKHARKGQRFLAHSIRTTKAGSKGQCPDASNGQYAAAPLPAPSTEDIIEALIQQHRYRRFAIKTQQKLNRSLESFVRQNFTAWSPDLPEKEAAKQNARVHQIIWMARNEIPGKIDEDPIVVMVRPQVALIDKSRKMCDDARMVTEKERLRLVRMLPISAWLDTVKGAAPSGLADIIGEAGDVGSYATHSKLWKRLGFAPYDGFAGSTWKRETWRPRKLTSEEWIANPFSGERYGIMRSLADSMFRANWQGADNKNNDTGASRPNGHYGELYARRRAHTKITHEDWSDGHAHADALRYMFKKYLRDLWKAWRRDKVEMPEMARSCLPSAAPTNEREGGMECAPEMASNDPPLPAHPTEQPRLARKTMPAMASEFLPAAATKKRKMATQKTPAMARKTLPTSAIQSETAQ